MSGLQMVSDLHKVEKDHAVDLQIEPSKKVERRLSQYAQFESDLRADAARMSEFYEVFYCLENSIRNLVKDALVDAEGSDWWNSGRVHDERIKKPCESRRKKEIDNAVTPRSELLIDYTTFGELSQLITGNWDIFGAVFTSKSAVSNVTNQLNLLRGPIAHCNPTDELEQERLNLAVRSWFKLIS
ncbi:Swt1 family HEPN domain-containing protein [Pseudooceanicola algae]|nr:Swt1 family HEPN domain-containing protein [Pseudooceanicola algae]